MRFTCVSFVQGTVAASPCVTSYYNLQIIGLCDWLDRFLYINPILQTRHSYLDYMKTGSS